MIKDPTLRILYDEFTKRLNALADEVSEGRCASFEDYKNMCGRISGLYEARDEVIALAKKVDDE